MQEMKAEVVSSILKYLSEMSKKFENGNVTVRLKCDGELEVIAHGLWSRYFNTKQFLEKVVKDDILNMHIYCIDKSTCMRLHYKPLYDNISKSYVIQQQDCQNRFSHLDKCLAIIIHVNEASVQKLNPYLKIVAGSLKEDYPNIIFNFVPPVQNLKEQTDIDSKTVARCIVDMLTFSQSDHFRQQCFCLLSVTCSGDVDSSIQNKLRSVTKSVPKNNNSEGELGYLEHYAELSHTFKF